jgi:hypothetical protein
MSKVGPGELRGWKPPRCDVYSVRLGERVRKRDGGIDGIRYMVIFC